MEAIDQKRRQRFTHADILDRNQLEAMPHVISDVGGGEQHLVGSKNGIVDVAAPDLLLQNGNQLIDR
jgi:hypothetical protein